MKKAHNTGETLPQANWIWLPFGLWPKAEVPGWWIDMGGWSKFVPWTPRLDMKKPELTLNQHYLFQGKLSEDKYRTVTFTADKGLIWISCSEPGRETDEVSISIDHAQVRELVRWLQEQKIDHPFTKII